jgi:hypothetical protein
MDPRHQLTQLSTLDLRKISHIQSEAEKEELRAASNFEAIGLYAGPMALVAGVVNVFGSSGPSSFYAVVLVIAAIYTAIGVLAHHRRKPWRDLIEACRLETLRREHQELVP